MSTGYNSTATTVSSLSDLYVKANTDVKISVKLNVEELKWFREYPRENITVSGNENRVPLLLDKATAAAAIAEGGHERVMITPAPTHGTFMPVQLNTRYGFTGLAGALDARSKGGMIENQIEFQAQMAGYSIARSIGLQTWGQSTGTVGVVKTTLSAGTVQVIPLKNAYGSSTLVAGSDSGGPQDAYLSSLYVVNDHVALIRSAALVEFGTVTASPSASSGAGFVDVTFTSSITPTVGDLVVLANADGDSTIAGTDVNNWAYGWTEMLTASSLLGVTTSSKPFWAAGSTSTATQRLGFQVKEKMINDCYTASGMTINRFAIPFGVRRDTIAGNLGGRRYDSAETDIEGDLNAGKGQKYYTSPLCLPGVVVGWANVAVGKIELAELVGDDGGTKSQFKLDKVQGVDQIAASYNYWYQKVPTCRGAMGYAANLTSQ